jgi:hypothetical protein
MTRRATSSWPYEEVASLDEKAGNTAAANVGLEDQAGALKDQYLRLNADFDNFKKRTLKAGPAVYCPPRHPTCSGQPSLESNGTT